MTSTPLSRGLASELVALTPRQREAVTYDGDVVVLAGPGSGKTRTIVARTAYLLETSKSPFRGVACITYTNPAAEEVRERLDRLGLSPASRLAASTVHSFCLRYILRPLSVLAGWPPPGRGAVLDTEDSIAVLQGIFDSLRITENPTYQVAELTKIRRAIASHESTDTFDNRLVNAATRYEELLLQTGSSQMTV